MAASFLLTLREGLEAALIVGLLLGALKKFNQGGRQSSIWLGTGAAALASVLGGYLLNLLGASFSGRGEQIFEGTTMLLAAGILTWVILWMGKHSRKLNEKLHSDTEMAVGKKGGWALFSLAFLAVIREGIELVVFLTAAGVGAQGTAVVAGAVLGLGTVVLISILLFKSLIRLNLGRFFQVTSVILVLFAAGLVAYGVHEFNEAGLIPPLIEHLWDINYILDEGSPLGMLLKSLLGYNGNPSLSEVLGYVLYLSGLSLGLLFRNGRKEHSGGI